ncbi:hypothetical protein KCP75_15050 [Salmonella enterica subsp. enterica]|nr:hypothetical protein KCP75_15050 [Salmonella enterica subsp. enterica]
MEVIIYIRVFASIPETHSPLSLLSDNIYSDGCVKHCASFFCSWVNMKNLHSCLPVFLLIGCARVPLLPP